MDRIIVYPGSIPLDTDLLNTNRNAMIALGALMQVALGAAPVVEGLGVEPTSPASMNAQVAPGSITQTVPLDANPYGTLGSDTADPSVKMGINIAPTFLTLAAPTVTGTSITYLVEAGFSEVDENPVALPYYNPANPSQPWIGPGGNGVAQATLRAERAAIQLKTGVAAPTGTQVAPAVDPGWIGLATITVNYGDTQILSGAIDALPTVPRALFKLASLRPGFVAVQPFRSSGLFTVPNGVGVAKVTVIGGGGAGGQHVSLPSGGGGAGGRAIRFVSGLVPGSQIPVTVGAGGGALAPGDYDQGGGGGTSSFGTFVSATGGQGGGGGTVLASCAGGPGGFGVGGDINDSGSYGTDGIMLTGKGGDGGGPGGGRGTSSLTPGIDGQGYGGGAGGGGSSSPGGTGTGAPGGNGASGLVIVEY
jgi:hypothetical protein